MLRDGGSLLERDLTPVRDGLEAARAGRGSTVIVEGPPGSGVSSILRAGADLARDQGIAVADIRVEPLPAPRVPALVLVDDVHWAGAAALQALIELRPALERLPCCVLLGHHPGPGRFDALAAHLLDDLGAVRLALAPLSPDAIAGLAAEHHAAEGFAPALHAATAGNPWLVRVALSALAERGLPLTPRALTDLVADPPEALRTRVTRLLATGSADVASLAGAIAVYGEPLPLARAARLADLPSDAAAVAADALAGTGLTTSSEPLAFVAPLLGAAVAASLPPFAGAAVHARAADLLRAQGAPPARIGRHLVHLPRSGDPEVVAALRAAAADAADDREAVRLLRRALAEPPEAHERADLLTTLALRETSAGDPHAADRVRDAMQLVGPGARHHRLQVALGRALLAQGDYPGAGAVAEAVLETLDPSDPRVEPLLVVELIATSADQSLHGPAIARAMPFIAAAGEGRVPDDPGLCAWLAAVLSSFGAIDQARPVLARALRDSPLVDDSHPSIVSFARAAQMNLDDPEAAERTATEAMARALERGLPMQYEQAQHGRALARMRLGRVRDARLDGVASMPGPGAAWTLHAPYGAALLTSVHVELGELDAARAALEVGRASTTNDMERAHIQLAEAELRLAERNPAAALRCALDAGAAFAAFGLEAVTPTVLPWQSMAARAALLLGDRDQAVELSDAELQRAEPVGLPGAIGIARHARALAETGADRVALLRRAAVDLARSPQRLEEARVLVSLGAALREAADTAGAREALAAALDLADRCGSVAVTAQARTELRQAGARPRRSARRGAAALTETERRVAERAALGETNAQIARELYVSVKTIEGTLARAYRKLEIGSRADLAGALADPSS